MKGLAITHLRTSTNCFVIALCMLPVRPALAQVTTSRGLSDSPEFQATQLTGLPDAKQNLKGQLFLADGDLRFKSAGFNAEIPLYLVKRVSIGEERIETGGKIGLVARKVIPYGGGMALATITQKSIDLLTLEYLDSEGRDHGAVFFMPKASAKALKEEMESQRSTVSRPSIQGCQAILPDPTSVVVEPIMSSGVELPAEYRVLLYENIIRELRDRTSGESYVRSESFHTGAGCPEKKLMITVTAFSKGNQLLRAATGPIGLFVGKTSVSFRVELTDANGHSILSENMTNSIRMDTESLEVAKSVAKAISKKIHKLPITTSGS